MACNRSERWIAGSVSILSLVLVLSPAVAEDIYKIVDEDGKVSYSTESPETDRSAEVIHAMPEPSQEDVEAAKQRQRDIEREFSRLDQQRAEQAFLEQEARRQSGTSVIHNTTVVVGGDGYRHGYRPGYGYPPFHPGFGRPGAPVAPGAPTAPGYRPPHAKPLPAGSHRKRRGP